MSTRPSRRQFLQAAVAAGTTLPMAGEWTATTEAAEKKSANEKLNLAVIGVAGRGGSNLAGVAKENIAVLCDIDSQRLGAAAKKFPRAHTTNDYRRVFDVKNLDGVVVSTPDHMHAIPVATALRNGLAVYCEKPLTHSIHECRTIARLTAERRAVTQMGNQIHNHPLNNYRRTVELVQAGTIGEIRRVHVWQGGGVRVGQRVKNATPPSHVNYDLWLGPAPHRPFHQSHFHFNWRYWWDFGGGQLADFVCHYMDLPYWALGLDYPTRILANGEKGHDGDNQCPMRMKVDYQFAAKGDRPAVHITWYHGGWKPKGAESYGKGSAVLFEGSDGRLLADYTTRKLFMAAGNEARPVKPTIRDSVGHHNEWLAAIRSGDPNTTCNFRYGAKLAECGHLGNLSYRLGKKEITWDAVAAKAVDCPEAASIIKRPYRKGWTL
ncbi:MAG: Gfo/Idh/MocA family oxidoreductase [Planctomycetaceae bacterium]|jgi:predicted dehydrogenase|nr:Gfo/Idh/MocA family oxidoreductase [Planctomycetaceae bacterium]